ncbi:MAG: hypothetical protein Q4B58_02635 [Bacteroidales bacterium]|nr:hypothetical protein [Bacteroidales bacterium]
MRKPLYFLVALTMILCLVACGNKDAKQNFRLSGSFAQDSLQTQDSVLLLIDNHENIERIMLPTEKGSFSYQGAVEALSELTLAYQKQILHIYATPGAQISFQCDQKGKVEWAGTDSLNIWLQEHDDKMKSLGQTERKHYLDSMCRAEKHEVRGALLLREQMKGINDSLFVRRCLGSIKVEAKPTWLVQAIDEELARYSGSAVRNRRLPREVLKLSTDTTYALLESRQESLLIFFWAGYNQASVDSLKMLTQIAQNYGLYDYEDEFVEKNSKDKTDKKPHRLELMTVCLYAADSASWHQKVDGLPGKHAWVQGGFAHPLLSSFNISSLPNNLQADRFGNLQSSGIWGSQLTHWLDNTPIKYSSTRSKINSSKTKNKSISTSLKKN